MKPNLPIKLTILVLSICLSGCTTQPKIDTSQIYKGYPCGDNCEAFKQGFDVAESKQFTSKNECDTIDSTNKIGCLSYVQEYTYEHEIKAVSFDSNGRQTN